MLPSACAVASILATACPKAGRNVQIPHSIAFVIPLGVPGRPSEDMNRWVVGRTQEEAAAAAEAKYPGKKIILHQDEDVLDTW